MLDPRRVRFDQFDSRNELTNLTIAYVENGRQYQMVVMGMFDDAVNDPIEFHEVNTPYGCVGIYDETGVEIWPSNCRDIKYNAVASDLSTAKLLRFTRRPA